MDADRALVGLEEGRWYLRGVGAAQMHVINVPIEVLGRSPAWGEGASRRAGLIGASVARGVKRRGSRAWWDRRRGWRGMQRIGEEGDGEWDMGAQGRGAEPEGTEEGADEV